MKGLLSQIVFLWRAGRPSMRSLDFCLVIAPGFRNCTDLLQCCTFAVSDKIVSWWRQWGRMTKSLLLLIYTTCCVFYQ